MNIKPGDNVRYLNAVGGGTVTRIEGKIAYVDEDGFETPVMISECVVVGAQNSKAWQETKERKEKEAKAEKEAQLMPQPAAPAPIIVETPGGDVVNITIGFEAEDLKRLSSTDFNAYLVNDSNYWLAYSFATRAEGENMWTPRSCGMLEPNYEGKLWHLSTSDLPMFDYFNLNIIAFKKDKPYLQFAPVEFIRKSESSKFARLHCFKPHRYFEVPVISWDIIKDGTPVEAVDMSALLSATPQVKAEDRRKVKVFTQSKPASKPEVTVIDLHATELLDTTAGMSPADILNYQIDVFRREMDSRQRTPGARIVFIHGKGNGVLRSQLYKELNHRYKGHDVRDASFAEYGFGATEVVIRNVSRDDPQKPHKK